MTDKPASEQPRTDGQTINDMLAWPDALTAEEIQRLANGADPLTIRPGYVANLPLEVEEPPR